MNVNALGGTHRPTHITPHVDGVGPARPVRRSDERSGATVDDEAVDVASDNRADRTQRRAEKFEARLDHVIEHKLEKVDAKIERFVERHDLSDSEVEAIAGYREEFEATLTTLVAGLADGGYEPGAIADFRDAIKEAMGTLRENVRGVLDSDMAVAETGDEVATEDPVEPAGEAAVAADAGVAGDGTVDTSEAVTGASDTVAATPVDEPADGEAETPETVAIRAELVAGLQEIRDAIDVFLESVAVDDAFDPAEVLLPAPVVDIQA